MTSANPEVMLARLARAVESRYRIEKEAGRGSMARVYQAVELATNRPVAIKLLPPEAATTTNAERFLREISLTRTLDHPNILPLIDSGTDDGLYWYVMPFLAGETIREALDVAGFARVRVGTVDRFQGQEAVISIVSLAASDADEVPRGIDFLLNRNRLNVAISRAQWAAYLVYSPGVTRFLPQKPAGVAELSRFLRLVGSPTPSGS